MNARYLSRLIAITGIALIIVVGLAIPATSRPSFCGSCHEIRQYYESWQVSGHQDVNCLSCHTGPGWTGLVQTKARGLLELYEHFRGDYELPIAISTENRAFSERCLKCHAGKTDEPEGSHNRKHFNGGVFCTNCHRGLVHDPARNRLLPGPEVCRRCHGSD